MTARETHGAQTSTGHSLRVLVAIASFGEKNLGYLRSIIQQYHAMAMTVDVVVLSEAPKDLPANVRVLVGLPSQNPRSLPFAHKTVFAENVDSYDLFIYSEDDIDVTEQNIQAFLNATEILKSDEIAGFLRYERDAAGAIWMPDAHGSCHWNPHSVVCRQGSLFAEYSNEHAALYVMTQDQLRRAIASGGFLRAPYAARYDMLVTAATDPYTSCGFRKMIGISHLEPFLVHHMSNRYAGQMGLPLSSFEEQLDTLKKIGAGTHPATNLCEVESKLAEAEYSKSFYELPHEALLAMMPAKARTVLSIGCGWGLTESRLTQRGAEVTALPLDSVIGAAAAKLGVKPIYGRLDEALRKVRGEKYDCVLISNLLHLQADPEDLFNRCAEYVAEGGTLVADSPNFDRLPTFVKRVLPNGRFRELQSFTHGGVSVFGPDRLMRSARSAGLSAAEVRWYDHSLPGTMGLRRVPLRLGRLTANSWVFRATRKAGAKAVVRLDAGDELVQFDADRSGASSCCNAVAVVTDQQRMASAEGR